VESRGLATFDANTRMSYTLQKQVELLTSVGDDLVVKTMVPRFSTKVTTPRNYSCVMQTEFVECLTDKIMYNTMHIVG